MAFLNVDIPPIQFDNSVFGGFSVEGHSEIQLKSNINVSNNSSISASYTIKPHNYAFGKFELVSPPRITKKLFPVMDTYVRNDAPTMNFNGNDLTIGDSEGILYRSFLRFDLSDLPKRLLFTKASLKFKALEISDEFTISIYKANSFWSENTTTFAGQPVQGEFIKNFNVSPLNPNIETDVKYLVQDWYNDNYNNYGIILKLNESLKQHKIRVGSKEISGYEPVLELEYFDPIIPQLKNAILKSYLNIPAYSQKELQADIIIHSYKEECILKSNIHIHILDTLESSIDIQKGTLSANISITTNSCLPCQFQIAQKKNKDLLSTIDIYNENLIGNVIINASKSLLSKLEIYNPNESSNLNSNINISKHFINSNVRIAINSTLLSNITIKSQSIKELRSLVNITKNSLFSNISIEKCKILNSEVTIATNNIIDASIFIPYREQETLNSNIFIMQNKSLYVNGFIRSPYLRSNIQIRRNDEENLNANIVIRDIYPYLLSNIDISAPWSWDLLSSITINNETISGNKAYGFIF